MRILFLQKYLPAEMIGIMYLSTWLKKAGHEVKAQFLPEKDWLAKVKEYDPQVLAYSTTTGDHVSYIELNRQVKELTGAYSVFGNSHATFVPDMIEEEGVDAVCRGEGEFAFADFCTKLEQGEDITKVKNFWVKKDGKIHKNPVRPLAKSLEDLGFPDRSVIYDNGECYREIERKIFITQRGCPNSCSYCFHHAWRDKVYGATVKQYVRKRSVSHVIEEINLVRESYPLRFVHYLDDIFNISDAWLDEFCVRWPKEVGLPFDVILRTNLTTEKQMKDLKRVGCIGARLAFEAANDYIRNVVYRKSVTMEDLKTSSKHVKDAGIRLTSLQLLGAPGGTLQDELDTLKLNIDCRVDHPWVSLLQPYAMTDINEYTQDLGIAVDAWDKFPEKFNRTTTVHHNHRKEVENLHKLFPFVVRFPFLFPMVPFLLKLHFLRPLYLVIYALWTEYLVSEQNQLWAKATGKSGILSLPFLDWCSRTSIKILLRIREVLFGKKFRKAKLKLQMQSDTLLHIDEVLET
jgi:radical SAM superfamily enzyme YgiQ (UPF0313 family)